MKYCWRLSSLVFTGILLSGCGFHLRKNTWHLDTLYPTMVCPLTGTHSLHQALFNALLTEGVDVLDAPLPNTPLPQITILSQSLTTQPLVYGADGELRRERLRMCVVFGIDTDVNTSITLATYRDRQLNSRQHLGDNSEKILLEREMQRDIIQQLFRYLSA